MRRRLAIVGLLGICLTPLPEAACGGRTQAGQVGFASWYGPSHQGHQTASGEHFSRGQLTAAHRS
jgi:rare lipoprotein A (peptidoglycan hydrolase)